MSDDSLDTLKLPPHSVEAEQSVLGGLLLENESLDKIADILRKRDFYRYDHQLIYQHICSLIENNRPADIVTVAESLDTSAELSGVGGIAYLGALAQNTPTAANIRRYAEIVRERAVMRKLVEVGSTIAESGYNPQGKDAQQLLDDAEAKIFEIAEGGRNKSEGFVDIKALLPKVADRIDYLYQRENQGDVTGVPTGFKDLDERTSGFQPGDLIIVAGRPSMGKAQPLDSLIKTVTGWKTMGELKLGDELASFDGLTSKVKGIFPQGMKQIYRVGFSDGRSAECCDEHLWRVMNREWKSPRIISTRRLLEMLSCSRYKNRLWIDYVSGDFGLDANLPIDPWVLGVMLGEGHLTFTRDSLTFSCASDALVDKVNDLLGYDLQLAQQTNHEYEFVWNGLRTVNGGLSEGPDFLKRTLGKLGLLTKVNQEKSIPDSYLNASKESRILLLQGLLDSDGWTTNGGSVRFATTSQRLAEDVAMLVRSLGGYCSISRKDKPEEFISELRKRKSSYSLNIHLPNGNSLLKGQEKSILNGHKKVKNRRLTITTIERSRMAEAQCISVTHPSQTYVTNDYIVTHNTAFSLNIAENVALDTKLPVAVFSMEMGATQLATRMIGSVGRLDQHRMRNGKLEDEDWARLTTALGKLNDAPIFIDEGAGLSSFDVRARARRLHRQCGKLGLIVVDYLQLMSSPTGRQSENRATEISEISRSLKALAKELDVPVVALSQLNRGLEQRTDKRPIMSDLRESGAIEQDADLILFIYRDEVYNPDSNDKGTAEIIIAKQRNGPIGRVRLTFIGENTRFENFASGSGYSAESY